LFFYNVIIESVAANSNPLKTASAIDIGQENDFFKKFLANSV
jgi:hypothetical protein